MVSLPDGKKISKISLFVLTWSTNVTDRRTDGQTDGRTLDDSKDRACIASRGKNHTCSYSSTTAFYEQALESYICIMIFILYKTGLTDCCYEINKILLHVLPAFEGINTWTVQRCSSQLYSVKYYQQVKILLHVVLRQLASDEKQRHHDEVNTW